MNWQSISFDWNQARAFLATAEEGSLSAAARALGQTQPTLGRQVAALEENLGVTLFERIGRSLTLTQTGLDLLDHFKSMGEAASRISLAASGQSQAIEGRVSITAADFLATYHLPPILKKLREVAPAIEIEIISANDVRDLMRREADIAIRHVRSEQPDLIAKLIGEFEANLYASSEFFERNTHPKTPGDLSNAQFIGVDNAGMLLTDLNKLGLSLTSRNFKIISRSGTVILELVKEGLGVGVIPKDVAEMNPELELALPEFPPIRFPVWLAAHRELHTSRRIRLVYDLLVDELSQYRAA